MIKIFKATDTVFNKNGIINIDPISCKETKKKSLNGWYLELQVNIKYKEYIKKGMLVVVKSKSRLNPQAFRIEEPKYNNNIIEFTANHVMFDAENYMLYDVRPTDKLALAALEYIDERIDNDTTNFSYTSDVGGVNTAYFQLKNLLQAWEVIEERWNGCFEADNWNISFLSNPGKNVGQMLVYKKNIESVIKYEDWSSVVTTIYPVGDNGLKLPEKFIKSDIQYDVPYPKKIEFTADTESEDAESEETTEKTEEELVKELRNKALEYLEENKYPKVSYELTSNIDETFDVNDKIIVKHPIIDLQTEVQEYTYNHCLKKTENLVFGNYTRDVKKKFESIKESISNLSQSVKLNKNIIKEQSDLINALNKNGLVYITDNEILILDSVPKESAKYVWKIGLGGFGFSATGYEGPFTTAWTQDGKINADFIQVGKINTQLIEGYDALEISVKDSSDQILNQNQKISKISQTVDELNSKISDIADITTSGESNYATIDLYNVNQSEPIYIKIRPVGEDISYLYPSDNLYPSDDLFLKDRTLRFTNNTTGEIIDYELPCDLWYYDSDNYDELILNYETQSCEVNKKVDINADGSKYLLSKPTTIEYDFPKILLDNGDYNITLLGYDNAYLFARLMAKNIYTTQFATRAEVNSSISQSATEINAKVDLKLDETEFTSANIILKINNDESLASINADKISLEGYTTINNSFSIDLEGNVTINGGDILLYDENEEGTNNPKFIIDGKRTIIQSYGANDEPLEQYDKNATAEYLSDGIYFETVDDYGEEHLVEYTDDGVMINHYNGSYPWEHAEYTKERIVLAYSELDSTGNGYLPSIQTIIEADGITTPIVTQTSKAESKKDFELLENALDIVNDTDIYKYHLTNENKKNKKHIGLVIGKEYKYSHEITSLNKDGEEIGVDTYSMVAVCFKAIKEQQKQIEELIKNKN